MSDKQSKLHNTYILRVKVNSEDIYKIPMHGKDPKKLVRYAENKENRVDSYDIFMMRGESGAIVGPVKVKE